MDGSVTADGRTADLVGRHSPRLGGQVLPLVLLLLVLLVLLVLLLVLVALGSVHGQEDLGG